MEPGSRTLLAFALTIAFVVALVAGALVADEVSSGGHSSSRGPTIDPCAGRVISAGPEPACDGTRGVGGTVLGR